MRPVGCVSLAQATQKRVKIEELVKVMLCLSVARKYMAVGVLSIEDSCFLNDSGCGCYKNG